MSTTTKRCDHKDTLHLQFAFVVPVFIFPLPQFICIFVGVETQLADLCFARELQTPGRGERSCGVIAIRSLLGCSKNFIGIEKVAIIEFIFTVLIAIVILTNMQQTSSMNQPTVKSTHCSSGNKGIAVEAWRHKNKSAEYLLVGRAEQSNANHVCCTTTSFAGSGATC